MGDFKNLSAEEGIKKIREIATAANICHFISNLTELPLDARPMATQEVDEEGNIWFLSKKESNKNLEIENDNRVQLLYANNSNYEYLSIYGTAEALKDKNKIEKYWSPMIEAWFQEGKNDPSITLIKVQPLDAYYWDTKSNKMIALLKTAVSAVTGKSFDDGIEGNISV